MKTPADVIYDLLTGACDGEPIDLETFSEAARRLEETGASTSAVVNDILEKIDAVLYASPVDSKIRLVRVGGGS